MAKGQGKGASFERQFAKQLSEWLTYGVRDDIFWRTQQSGGRATQRAKSGQTTQGQYGDIAATDPAFAFITNTVCFELKRGYPKSDIHTTLDKLPSERTTVFESFIQQAVRSANDGGMPAWLLVTSRDRKVDLITAPTKFVATIVDKPPVPSACVRYLIESPDHGETSITATTFRASDLWEFCPKRFTEAVLALS